MADHKRVANFGDDHSATKRSEVADIDIIVENNSCNADCNMSVRNQSVSDKVNGKTESNSDEKLSRDSENNPVTCIEADAAEDKGSRHTMGDAWVVLLDASFESPGKLRLELFYPLMSILWSIRNENTS